VVIGGVCLAVAAALCTLVIEPVTAESSRSLPDDERKDAAGEERRSDGAGAADPRKRLA